MTRWWLVLLLILANAHPAGAAEPEPPKILAFIAGVEHYADQELDKLQYASDDARDIYKQLEIVADLDPDSKLLVADDLDESEVSAEELRVELELFARNIDHQDNVVIYLGGHGTLSPTDELLYLPSDFDPERQVRYLPFREIVKFFEDQVRAKPLTGVRITFLVNICGAGNAADSDPTLTSQSVRQARERERIDVAQELYNELEFGEMRVAIIPAAPRDRDAFEDATLKRSRFAHHLLEGMKGRAADDDGALTTGELFAFVQKSLGEELPKNPDFDNDIIIGRTNRLEGEAHLILGTALLGAAQAIAPTAAAIEETDAAEHAAHARALRDLAGDQLRRVERRTPELGPRAQLRLVQSDAASLEENFEGVEVFSELANSDLLSEQEREQVKAIAEADVEFPTLSSFREHLKTNPHTRVVLLTGPQLYKENESSIEAWQHAFADVVDAEQIVRLNLPGLDRAEAVDRSAQSSELIPLISELQQEDQEHRRTGGASPLVVVYTGSAYVHPDYESCLKDHHLASCRLGPIDHRMIGQVREVWGAPFGFFYDAPFGGFLLGRTPKDVPLLLAASEHNGMTFSGGDAPGNRSTSELLAQAFSEGTSFGPLIVFQRISAALALAREQSPPFVAGTPAWVPGPVEFAFEGIAAKQLGPLRRLGLHVAAGCLSRPLVDCDEVGRSGTSRDDVLEELENAARLDLSREVIDGVGEYRRVVTALGAFPPTAEGALGGESAREALALIADMVNRRAGGAASKEGRRVVVLPAGVADYSSPLVADVPHAIEDLEGYAAALKLIVEDPTTRVEVLPPVNPGDAAEFVDKLKQVRAELEERPQDILVLIFSGRGAEIDGRRYLVMADAEVPTQGIQGGVQVQYSSPVSWNAEALVELGAIAQAVEGAWFLGIYDAQFTPPEFEPGRGDQLLDKHLDSVRPSERTASVGASAAAPGTPAAAPGTPAAIRPAIASRGALPPRQVHLWVEGRLTQHASAPHPCVKDRETPPEVASPLAAAVISSLTQDEPGTYRDWLRPLARDECLNSVGERSLVMQGDVDVPLLGSGEGAEFVGYFHAGGARRDLNLRSALAVAQDVAQRFPSAENELAVAALLLALAQLHSADATLHGFDDERKDWLRGAEQLLAEDIRPEELENGSVDLRPVYFEMLSRVYLLRNEPEKAREALRDAPAALLTRRGLAQRLVALTQESLRSQPIELLDRIREKLEQVQATGLERGLDAAVGRDSTLLGALEAELELRSLMQAERERLAAPYRISLPRPTR